MTEKAQRSDPERGEDDAEDGRYCQVEKEEELFKITLWFPAVREE